MFLKNDAPAPSPISASRPTSTRSSFPPPRGRTRSGANVFAPAVWDWNRDGKEDLLLGEGSYSANNIHLLINSGSPGRPVFEETNPP